MRNRRRKSAAPRMVVSLVGSFATLTGRHHRRAISVAVTLRAGEVVIHAIDPDTKEPFVCLTVGSSESVVAAIHALETDDW